MNSLPTYFTCTLGERGNIDARYRHHWVSVKDLLDEQARVTPDNAAVGFPLPALPEEIWTSEVFSFKELRDGSIAIAAKLLEECELPAAAAAGSSSSSCIALLCPSSVDFLFVWLGLMSAGCSVLLLAPQCDASTITHLCNVCNSSALLYHASYAQLAFSAANLHSSLKTTLLPWSLSKEKMLSLIQENQENHPSSTPWTSRNYVVDSQSTAYIHHTSGTSGGLPKPIPQSHHAAIGVLPCLPCTRKATFTTTPLYHGGIADCFRSWSSGELIWLFPGAQVPITERNIVSSLSSTESESLSPVKYFSSVPYVLKMLAGNDASLEWLKRMDIVGVGGAALSPRVGDFLVEKGVHLVSRFGSAECGFLLSSHRDYDSDVEWQYLRTSKPNQWLQFQAQGEGSHLAELIVLEGWPHMARKDADSNFATGDLFEPHKSIEGAWKYSGRKDGLITLSTGKKFDPVPIEESVTAYSPLITDALVFGTGRQIPGILVFVKDKNVQVLVNEAVSRANQTGDPHTFIHENMVILREDHGLVKSSKGTVMRKASESKFEADMSLAYDRVERVSSIATPMQTHKKASVKERVKDSVQRVTGKLLKDHENFYNSGIDSAACLGIRSLLYGAFELDFNALPWSLIYDCGDINGLTQYLEKISDRKLSSAREEPTKSVESQAEEMLRMVKHFTCTDDPTPQASVVILTGGTGALGAHVLKELLRNRNVSQVYCLVRAKTNDEAHERILKSLESRRIEHDEGKVSPTLLYLASELDKENFGLDLSTYNQMRARTTLIIHAAWPVNFSLPLSAFQPSLQGLHNLLQLTHSHRPTTFILCSSTAAVLAHPSRPIPELPSSSPLDAGPLGYSQSKWVAEAICHAAAARTTPSARIRVARIGQLTGDTTHGAWNRREAYPLILSTMRDLGCLPDLRDSLDWLPLDIAARAIVDIAFSEGHEESAGRTPTTDRAGATRGWEEGTRGAEVYHVLNKHTAHSWTDLLLWLQETTTMHGSDNAGSDNASFEIVSAGAWLDRLEALGRDHPAKALLGFWRAAYGDQERGRANGGQERDGGNTKGHGSPEEDLAGPFETRRAARASRSLRGVGPVDRELVRKIWAWLDAGRESG